MHNARYIKTTRADCRKHGRCEVNCVIHVCGKRCRIEAIEDVRVSFAETAYGGRSVNHCYRTRVLLRRETEQGVGGRVDRQWCFLHDNRIDTSSFAG